MERVVIKILQPSYQAVFGLKPMLIPKKGSSVRSKERRWQATGKKSKCTNQYVVVININGINVGIDLEQSIDVRRDIFRYANNKPLRVSENPCVFDFGIATPKETVVERNWNLGFQTEVLGDTKNANWRKSWQFKIWNFLGDDERREHDFRVGSDVKSFPRQNIVVMPFGYVVSGITNGADENESFGGDGMRHLRGMPIVVDWIRDPIGVIGK
ncbi:MAG: hypothetical protein WCJ09_15875 [Planctomycetota bacterium]